jgi:hypothetical protein
MKHGALLYNYMGGSRALGEEALMSGEDRGAPCRGDSISKGKRLEGARAHYEETVGRQVGLHQWFSTPACIRTHLEGCCS